MSNLLNLPPAEFCTATKACDEGHEWALTQPTMSDVWDNCPCAEWLLWTLDKLDRRPDDRTLRLFAVWCARNTPLADGRKTGDVLTDPRSLAALEVAERYANGRATVEELAAAADAARYAARDAAWAAAAAAAADAAWAAAADAARDAARYAAWYAARDAARDAAADAARDAARYAARAAAQDAAWDAARYAAWYAARDAAWDAALAAAWDAARAAARDAAADAQADHLRTLVPNPFRKEAQP